MPLTCIYAGRVVLPQVQVGTGVTQHSLEFRQLVMNSHREFWTSPTHESTCHSPYQYHLPFPVHLLVPLASPQRTSIFCTILPGSDVGPDIPCINMQNYYS